METVKMKKQKGLLFDIIFIVSLIVLSSAAIACLYIFRQDGKSVSVEINGERVALYSLADEGKYILNGGTNILVIENGEAYISEAHCPDRTCVKAGRLRHVGQSAVCLPNRVSVTVVGDDPSGVDLVS